MDDEKVISLDDMKLLLKLMSYIYRLVISIRHWAFDSGLIKSHQFKTPVICVGNITVGGTGKTPTAEMIIDNMMPYYRVALLSRGYGRRTKGYLEVDKNSSYRDVGDEPLQIKLKYPDTLVVVCEDRVEAINRIEKEHPEINLIVMDDGFQHRYVEARINVIIVDSTRPFYEDDYLPAGTLRDKIESLDRAHYFIVTKCPEEMSPLDQRMWRKELHRFAYQKIYFTRVISVDAVSPFYPSNRLERGDEVIVMSGIGNPKAFIKDVKREYKVVAKVILSDHHVYSVGDLRRVEELLEKHPNAKLLTTEKDAVKLRRSRRVSDNIRQKMFYRPLQVEFLEGSDQDFFGTLKDDLDGKIHFGNLKLNGDNN